MADLAFGSVGRIIDIALKIKEAVKNVKQNEKECRDIEKCVARVTALIKRLDELTEAMEEDVMRDALGDLAESLQGALELVTKCQRKHVVRRFIGAGDMARELRLVQDDILRKVTIGSFATNVVQLGITLMTIAQASAPAPHPQNRSEKDETKLSTGCGVPSDHLSGLRKFNLSELEVATQNFSVEKLIGRGSYGAVFKGVLRNGQVVAIKDMRISVVNDGDEVLHNEINIGRKLQHRNVVKILGYCIDDQMVSVWHEGQEVEAVKQRRLLVNGYLPNGSLNQTILQGTQGICWPFCFRILQGIAQGLHYLHEQNILHLDPKPENIIFDSDMNPVIIDFGLSVVLDNEDDIVTTDQPVGTLGYMAPEYINNGVVSKKQDVFAFGVVLLQTIFRGCAKVDFHDYYYRDADSKWDGVLQQDVDKIKEIFDPTLVEESELADVARCLMVGLLCREFDPADRPTMAEVLDMLNGEKECASPKRRQTNIDSKSSNKYLFNY